MRRACLALFVLAVSLGMNGDGCQGLTNPPQETGVDCRALNSLTCVSPSILDGKQCCIVAENANAGTGYACACGYSSQWAGCYARLEQANRNCPLLCPSVQIIQCFRITFVHLRG